MECDRRIGGRCKDEKHFGKVCSRLRPWICETRKKRDQNREKIRRATELQQPGSTEPLGIGA